MISCLSLISRAGAWCLFMELKSASSDFHDWSFIPISDITQKKSYLPSKCEPFSVSCVSPLSYPQHPCSFTCFHLWPPDPPPSTCWPLTPDSPGPTPFSGTCCSLCQRPFRPQVSAQPTPSLFSGLCPNGASSKWFS